MISQKEAGVAPCAKCPVSLLCLSLGRPNKVVFCNACSLASVEFWENDGVGCVHAEELEMYESAHCRSIFSKTIRSYDTCAGCLSRLKQSEKVWDFV